MAANTPTTNIGNIKYKKSLTINTSSLKFYSFSIFFSASRDDEILEE
jgi:hypothetical protein